MKPKAIKAEAHRLIDLATLLVPESEGIDLTDNEYEVQDMARLKDKLSSMRRTIDIINKGLATAWYEKDEDGRADVDGLEYYLGRNTAWVWQDEDSGLGFAKWLKKQSAETVEAIVPDRSIRIGQVPESARDSFFRKRVTSESLTIKNKKPY